MEAWGDFIHGTLSWPAIVTSLLVMATSFCVLLCMTVRDLQGQGQVPIVQPGTAEQPLDQREPVGSRES